LLRCAVVRPAEESIPAQRYTLCRWCHRVTICALNANKPNSALHLGTYLVAEPLWLAVERESGSCENTRFRRGTVFPAFDNWRREQGSLFSGYRMMGEP
jgi:hypothetical protein